MALVCWFERWQVEWCVIRKHRDMYFLDVESVCVCVWESVQGGGMDDTSSPIKDT